MCLKTVLDTTDKYDAGIYKEMKVTKWYKQFRLQYNKHSESIALKFC